MPSSRDLPNPGIKPVSLMSPALALIVSLRVRRTFEIHYSFSRKERYLEENDHLKATQ